MLEEEENGFSWEVHHGDESSDNANHTDSILQVNNTTLYYTLLLVLQRLYSTTTEIALYYYRDCLIIGGYRGLKILNIRR